MSKNGKSQPDPILVSTTSVGFLARALGCLYRSIQPSFSTTMSSSAW